MLQTAGNILSDNLGNVVVPGAVSYQMLFGARAMPAWTSAL
jgi:hypothetical protein